MQHDLTAAGWRVRMVRRVLYQATPFAIALALLPGRLDVRIPMAIFVLAASGGTAVFTADALRNRRLRQHGLDVPQREADEE